MDFTNFKLQPPFSVGVVSQSEQLKSAHQPAQNTDYLVGIFITFTIIGFLLGCLLRYRRFQKDRHQCSIEIIRKIGELNNMQEQVPNRDREITNATRKEQIRILEEIWKKSS